MMLKKIHHSLMMVSIFFIGMHCGQNNPPVVKGSYFGQDPPGMTPKVFAPGIVSTGLDELNSVFSPNGQEFYFCVRNPQA